MKKPKPSARRPIEASDSPDLSSLLDEEVPPRLAEATRIFSSASPHEDMVVLTFRRSMTQEEGLRMEYAVSRNGELIAHSPFPLDAGLETMEFRKAVSVVERLWRFSRSGRGVPWRS
jgi:hypothetical protein